MSKDATWVQEVIAGWTDPELPDRCEQFGCRAPAATWCPLCRSFFCHYHDDLYPVRHHDCLRGPAEA